MNEAGYPEDFMLVFQHGKSRSGRDHGFLELAMLSINCFWPLNVSHESFSLNTLQKVHSAEKKKISFET